MRAFLPPDRSFATKGSRRMGPPSRLPQPPSAIAHRPDLPMKSNATTTATTAQRPEAPARGRSRRIRRVSRRQARGSPRPLRHSQPLRWAPYVAAAAGGQEEPVVVQMWAFPVGASERTAAQAYRSAGIDVRSAVPHGLFVCLCVRRCTAQHCVRVRA